MSSTDPYQAEAFPPSQPLTTFLWEVRGDRVEATGACPRCWCVTSRVWGETQYVEKGPSKAVRKLFAGGEPRYALCQCASWHVGRPAEVPDGCGASFWIALPPRGLTL
ncbi:MULTISPECIES: hypothetical protein [unclassified Streptomyces]|uniref:hypothetical protein n=1 Tax=unclassified Streptomyces TaxID=2593676 RepID=UPI001660E9EB|nr:MULTISPECIES: hypothetical protein [unclassified Streptomyces]MBD0711859.1 hypothetical protein [Streptomyces sp. CBMA291]MBD0717648.1 hypothetical protein [Streptomyces sp. CBMA370]